MRTSTFPERFRARGFTLIELMMVVAIVAIVAAVAMPSYSAYVLRGKIIDATAHLGDLRTQMEKYFMDNRTYLNGGGVCGVTTAIAAYNADPAANFTYACGGTATTYVLSATGNAARGMGGFTYQIDQTNAKLTAAVPVAKGWAGTGAACWVIKADGSC
jgi:type IV pilus assembly protein PilE